MSSTDCSIITAKSCHASTATIPMAEAQSDHVFALCALLGFQFAPRIPDLKVSIR